MTVVTRFAPSPTGYLHIGSARTALFNWLFARHHGGVFRLRIEDTDRQRSTQVATDAIITGMQWLGLDWDGETVHQFALAGRHHEVALQLLQQGRAYYCYTSTDELAALRAQGKSYDRRWREGTLAIPAGVKPVIRLKSPLEGEIIVRDRVRGDIRVHASQLEDLVILRSDGTPTYNLAVVVDDHDMGVTHIIRGEDHITNAAKQIVIYQQMGWDVPEFAHVPLIHGADGAKLSKRHGALGVEEYRRMGYLPEALRNYLLRLGWSHGDDEMINTEQAIAWFNLESIGKSASRFDFTRLDNLNGYYIREADNVRLADLVLEEAAGCPLPVARERLLKGMNGLKQRAKTVRELVESAGFYLAVRPLPLNDKARVIVKESKSLLQALLPLYAALSDWSEETTQAVARNYAEHMGTKLGNIAQPLRAALSGSTISPGVFEIMAVLEKEESMGRISDVLG